MRWSGHWWQRIPKIDVEPAEPKVWVDPELALEVDPAMHRPRTRFAAGTIPPPSVVGPYCSLDPAQAEGIPEHEPVDLVS